jgi:hypothetical protein
VRETKKGKQYRENVGLLNERGGRRKKKRDRKTKQVFSHLVA